LSALRINDSFLLYTNTPPTHSPEKRSSVQKERVVYSQGRQMNTADRVMAKIANLKLN